jgi:CPA2 family monovalent cation:H+ antiporter-2
LFAGVLLLRGAIGLYVAPYLAMQRSRELVMLFSLILLAVVCVVTHYLGLPEPLGALAAGLALGGNRLTHQIDALMLSFRETFAALFFVGLGLLFEPRVLINDPLFMLLAFGLILAIKMAAGMLAARSTGLSWQASAGVGLALTQVGEFAFVIALAAAQAGLISEESYQRILILALASLMITPRLVKIGMRWTTSTHDLERAPGGTPLANVGSGGSAIVIGIGPVGRNVAHRLRKLFAHVTAVDLSPVNLHELAQDGIATISGDATHTDVLIMAGIHNAGHIFICVPSDDVAQQIVTACRRLNPNADVLVRCRFLANVSPLKRAGAKVVISEESQSAQALMKELDKLNEG